MFRCGLMLIWSGFVLYDGWFIFDCLSFYLVLLVLFLGVYSQVLFFGNLTNGVRLFLVLRLVFRLLCFCINHCVVFWCFYELSMLPLLYLIFKESPYSERFLAGWYFSGYLLITSLPLILILLYLSILKNRFLFTSWKNNDVHGFVFMVLSFVFFTKVPLVPFHTWLPIVHAEATSIVSVFLSGYIMKLGLLGVYRCSYFIFNIDMLRYLFVCCLICLCFLVTACSELDGKRWLAFLRLAHIVVPFLGFFVSDWFGIGFSFLYCLGHGLGAGIVFGLLWYFYDLTNTRNWLLVKYAITNKIVLILSVFSLLTLCSFPVTVQFFCEIVLIKRSCFSFMYLWFWVFYLFFGGLIPLILCGHLLIRSERFEGREGDHFCYFYFLFYLCVWCYFGVMIL